jgi:hypothetical protein
LTPDGDRWNPNATYFAEAEAAMLDFNGELAEKWDRPNCKILEAEVSELYVTPCTRDEVNDAVDSILFDDELQLSRLFSDNKETKLGNNGICTQLDSIDACHEPLLFLAEISEQAHMSNASIELGSTSIDNGACQFFEADLTVKLALAFSMLAAVTAGQMRGVTPEHLSKVWSIPFVDATKTLQMTTQCLRCDSNLSLPRSAGTNDQAVSERESQDGTQD